MKFTYLVGVGIVVLLVIWWWQEKGQQVDFSQASPASTESRMLDPTSEPETDVSPEPSVENINALSSVEAEAADEPSVQPVELVSEPVAEAANEIETQAKVEPQAEPETVTEAVAETASNQPTARAAEPTLVNSPEPETEVNQATTLTALSMSFENECWVEIRDATGKRLVADIKQPGQSLSVTGPSPYSIVLGTNAGVSVSYGQESIDLSSFKRGKVVRMKIPNN
jgi:cytoskeleton protein RodZ